MKIAYFLDIPKGLGGAGNVLLEQAKLMNAIHEVLVVIPCNFNGEMNPEYERRCKLAHLKCVGLHYPTAFSLRDIDLMASWDAVDAIRDLTIKEQIEFFHSVQINVAAELVSRELGIPHLMNIYQIRQAEFVLDRMDVFPKYHSCDSRLYCKRWGESLGMTTRCIRPSAPLGHVMRKQKKDQHTLKILMLGVLGEHKNQMLAIRAAEYCTRAGVSLTLTIAGNDMTLYAERCKEYVKKQGLEKMVDIVGFKSDVAPLLEESDCYLCTSTVESFPSAIVEAMTYGLAIISTPVAGVPELLEDGVNAFVSKGYETEDIAGSIMKYLYAYENGKIKEIHKNAAALWEEHFSCNAVRQKLDKYYNYIVDDFPKKKKQTKVILENQITEMDVRSVYRSLWRESGLDGSVYAKCYYYACLKMILRPGTAYIWGAGNWGQKAKILLSVLFPQIDILAYIDRKKRGEYQGKKIVPPEAADFQNIDYIFVCFFEGREETVCFLEGKHLQYNKQVWFLP